MNAQSITKDVGGKWHGSYGLCHCPGPNHAHGDKHPSLQVSDGEQEVMVHCFAGCDWREVKSILRSRGLLPASDDNTYPQRPDPDELERIRQDRAEKDAKRSLAALRVWKQCSPASSGGLADTYLKSRGLWLPDCDVIQETESLIHGDSGQAFPAMVCLVEQGSNPVGVATPDPAVKGRCPIGIHRTYLCQDGAGKALVDRNKAMLGRCSGGAVRLFPIAEKMAVAEGVETALAVNRLSSLNTWAALSTSGLIGLILPDQVRNIVIAADNDQNGAGERAAIAAAKRWTAEGRKVEITMPSKAGTDWLDHLNAGGV